MKQDPDAEEPMDYTPIDTMKPQKIYILIEWTGNSTVVDGAIIQGVFSSYESAAHVKEAMTTTRTLVDQFEIQEHIIDQGNYA